MKIRSDPITCILKKTVASRLELDAKSKEPKQGKEKVQYRDQLQKFYKAEMDRLIEEESSRGSKNPTRDAAHRFIAMVKDEINEQQAVRLRTALNLAKVMADLSKVENGKQIQWVGDKVYAPMQRQAHSINDVNEAMQVSFKRRIPAQILRKWIQGLQNAKRKEEIGEDFLRNAFREEGKTKFATETKKIWVEFLRYKDELDVLGKRNGIEVPESMMIRSETGDLVLPARPPFNPSSDSMLVGAVSFEEWFEFIDPLLAHDQFRKGLRVDARILTAEERKEVLRQVYETITTEGRSKSSIDDEWNISTKQELPYRLQEAYRRILHFSNAENWIAYNRRFGRTSIYQNMMDYISARTARIAAVQWLGPEAPQVLEAVINQAAILQIQTGNAKQKAKVKEEEFQVRKLWDVYTGVGSHGNQRLAEAATATRNLLSASQLAGASVVAFFSDRATMMFRSMANGIPQSDMIQSFFLGLDPNNPAHRQMVIDNEIPFEIGNAALIARMINSETILSNHWSQRTLHFVMRWSGMTRHTLHSSSVSRIRLMMNLDSQKNVSFAQLDSNLRATMSKYDIGETDWDIFRREAQGFSEVPEGGKISFLDPVELVMSGDRAKAATAAKFSTYLYREVSEGFVLTRNARMEAQFAFKAPTGTWSGEGVRFMAQYKRFPILMFFGNFYDVVVNPFNRSGADRIKLAAALTVHSFLAGAFIVQAKNFLAGRDLQDPSRPSFWVESLHRSGSAAFIFDLLYASVSPYDIRGRSFLDYVFGPFIGALPDLSSLTAGNIGDFARGEEDFSEMMQDMAYEFTRFANDNLVPGKSMWWAATLWQRAVIEQIEDLIDPDRAERARRLRERRAREQGSGYWWGPGSVMPERFPRLGEGR